MSRSNRASSDQAWPELILSARPFLGASDLSKDVDLDYRVRFSDPAKSAGVVAAAVRHGMDAIAPMNDATLLRALDLVRADHRLQVYPIIPNVIGYVRDATDYGMVGAGLRLVRRLGVADLLGIGLRGVTSLRRVLARDFTTMLSILIEVEMAAFKRFRPPLVLLHSQVADIAVALGNTDALRVFADVVRRRFGAEPGLVTNNFGMLLRAVTRAKVDIPVIVAPFNASGFLMKPSKQACESLLADTDSYIIADRITGGGAPLEGAFEYLHGRGIRSAVVEIAEPAAVDQMTARQRNGPFAEGAAS